MTEIKKLVTNLKIYVTIIKINFTFVPKFDKIWEQ
jgi:hypothetical protein